MNNNDFEDELRKAILNGEVQFVPAKELGMDDSDFMVDVNYWNEQMYDMYKDSCHRKDSLDSAQSLEKHIDPNGKKQFACFGRVGFFEWNAVSLYFDENIHKMNDEKQRFNSHHQMSMADEFIEHPGENLSLAINNDNHLLNLLRNPVVANMSDTFKETNWRLREMETHLRHFMQLPLFSEKEVFTHDENKVVFNHEIYKGKDVIIPFIYATTQTLEIFGRYAKKLADSGANTVIGIFATRIVPTIDGREGRVSSDYQVRSFSPRLDIGGLLGALNIK